MKPIKVFGLTVLALLITMAFVGVSSAMAESTALCNVDPGEGATEACPSGHLITSVQVASVGKAKLLTSFFTVECEVLFSGTTSSSLANPLVLDGNFTYSNCNNNCTATEENGPAEIKVLKEGHETSKVTGEGLVHVKCEKTLDCSYNGTGLKGVGKGPLLSEQVPDNGEVSIQEQVTTKEAGGFLCPKTAKLDLVITPTQSCTAGGPVYITD